ncbi:urea amidolyase associated protein UAAP1 [Winogradskya humida]|uniref:Urea carboxylase n=1 Tax=Winogradskya humida TaxID=113566 RepID=A0ABQ4A2K7_9ACTN|nr:urea amidolyase associated protein UAAP1 [Actinoplanes humidus]GIE25094.1 urea carboxylase [Actinoplanes humidus]
MTEVHAAHTTDPVSDARASHTTDSVLAARADARARAGEVAEAMPYVPASTSPYCPPGVAPESLLWAETVAGGGYTHRLLPRGARIRFEDPAGDACAHVLLYNAREPAERLNIADTQKIPWQAYVGTGHPLLSGDGRVLATVVEDSSGHHDAFCGTSSPELARSRYGAWLPESATPAGRELFLLAALKHGLGERDLPPSVSFFQGVRVAPDGSLDFTGSAGAGRHVDLVAEMPLIVLVANVPHPIDPRPGYHVTPLRVHAWASAPTNAGDQFWNASPERERAYLNTLDYLTSTGELS